MLYTRIVFHVTPRQGGVLLSVLSEEEGEGRGRGDMFHFFSKTTDRIGMKFCMKLSHHEGQLTKHDGTHHSNGCHGNDKKHCFLGFFFAISQKTTDQIGLKLCMKFFYDIRQLT